MKLLSLSGVIAIALAAVPDHVGRVKRSGESVFSFNGDESPDDLMNVLKSITAGTEDDIEQLIMNMMGVDRISTDEQIRKFRNLKILVLWLQKEKKFGRYCYYGCYCLPEGSHNIAAGGYGKPLDPIDQSCFDFKQCYRCLIDEHKGKSYHRSTYSLFHQHQNKSHDGACRGEEIGYAYELMEDQDGVKSIDCLNKAGSCRRNICECDKALAVKFAKHEDSWNENYHTNKGGFDREANCHRGSGGVPFKECCGNRFDFPFNQPRKENQCCSGTEAKPVGTC